MTSRQRVKAALRFQPVDRVPLDAVLLADVCRRERRGLGGAGNPAKDSRLAKRPTNGGVFSRRRKTA